MRAWTPQTAPPVSIAIVRRSPIVRVVQIIVPPASAEAGGTIGPWFSLAFPLTRERLSATNLVEQGGAFGARAHPGRGPPVPAAASPSVPAGRTTQRRPG